MSKIYNFASRKIHNYRFCNIQVTKLSNIQVTTIDKNNRYGFSVKQSASIYDHSKIDMRNESLGLTKDKKV